MAETAQTVQVGEVSLEVVVSGSGPTLLLLHGGRGFRPSAPFLDLLAKHVRVIAPSHPGFGHSSLPESIDTIDDLAYFYLDLMDEWKLDNVILMGFSIGGWIAAEIAVKCCHRLSKLILVDSVGIKVGDRETRDIADVYSLPPTRIAQLTYHDPASADAFLRRDVSQLSDDDLTVIARNRESLAMYTWQPYMHNPKLRQRLHRIAAPTLLIWGESDGIVAPAYGAAFRDAIPGAQLVTIPEAGHAPYVEQPEAFVERVLKFISS